MRQIFAVKEQDHLVYKSADNMIRNDTTMRRISGITLRSAYTSTTAYVVRNDILRLNYVAKLHIVVLLSPHCWHHCTERPRISREVSHDKRRHTNATHFGNCVCEVHIQRRYAARNDLTRALQSCVLRRKATLLHFFYLPSLSSNV